MPTDDYAFVLDYLPEGHADVNIPQYRREKRVAQILGEEYYSLLEVSVREGQSVSQGEKIYIGKATREKIHHIIRRLNYDDLTSTGKVEIEYTLEKLVKEQEPKFVRFFNECSPLTTRLHRLELLPGIGKKHMWDMTKARTEKTFESFKEILERIKLLPDIEKMIIKRIIWELKGIDDRGEQIKYKIFVGVPLPYPEGKEPKREEPPAPKPE
ncbi:TPA: DUF655 domain-containing protein [archaeon]|uniref:DUF655 domain-containing protein n=1 Tax=Candidatus Naiadarchaeum limnaeum TaxID=2756139 RepID=A0A832UP53_9ARCH|nr:DUF655 domain-containing protein [Candidatus Naiadarchaeales archaeon SRR2090153.bin1042]HIK00824.1 DUF655 domain-containing protein [Candidatus Naiadarchaeum limnaeum]